MHIAVITTTRADWGLLSPVARELMFRGAEVSIIAANMHFVSELGLTYKEIEEDGFQIAASIYPGNTPAETAAKTLKGVYDALSDLKADVALILGDRYEALAAAQGAVLAHVPIVHIAGGVISEGAFDDSFRHAITKLSRLHLVETDEYRRRVIQMGEQPDSVIVTGAIGLHNLLEAPVMPKSQLEESLEFSIGNNCLLTTMHAATLSKLPAVQQIENLIDALEIVDDCQVIFTYPNNDTDPQPLIRMIEAFALRNRQRVRAIPSLGMSRYAAALHYVKGVVGNSSSGIVEAPSAGVPTLDIGIRQKGRTAAPSVIHCGESAEEIAEGIRKILSPDIQTLAAKKMNPYYRPDTLNIICDSILNYPFSTLPPKKFTDL